MSEPKLMSREELDRMSLWSLVEWAPEVDGPEQAVIARNQIKALFAHIAALEAEIAALKKREAFMRRISPSVAHMLDEYDAPTPALALCAAVVKAEIERKGEKP